MISDTESDHVVVQTSGDENDWLYTQVVGSAGRISDHSITSEETEKVPGLLSAASATHQIGDAAERSIVNDGRDAPTDVRPVAMPQRGRVQRAASSLRHVSRCHDVDAGTGDVGEDHFAHPHRTLDRYLAQ